MSDRQKDLHLFIPGPASVSSGVLEAMGHPITPHYGDDFVAAYNRCLECMQQVFMTANDLYLVVGPGTAAIDAALTSALPDGAPVLVLTNGFFGTRFVEMCQMNRAETEVMEFEPGQAIDAGMVEERLAKGPRVAAVVWVHHETSMGVLNPVEPIAAAARQHGALSIVDAVASIGGTAMRVDDWGVDLCVSVGNKCLATPPGIAAISVSDRAWDAIDRNDSTRGWYLDLRTWRKYRQNWPAWHPYPTTVPTSVLYALRTGLEEVLAEGLESRIARTAEAANAVRRGLRQVGFEMFVEDAWASPITTSVKAHPSVPADELLGYLRDVHNMHLSGGIGPMHGKIFRIGHMGRAIEREEVELLLHAIEEGLRREDVEIPLGASLEGIWPEVAV
jgi:alanine-glyoxylate transaminase/serine-glyoxylate transaminase/serine-pyruvate transaminase